MRIRGRTVAQRGHSAGSRGHSAGSRAESGGENGSAGSSRLAPGPMASAVLSQAGLQGDRFGPRCFMFMGPFSPKIPKAVFYSGIGIKTNVMFSLKSSFFPFLFKIS